MNEPTANPLDHLRDIVLPDTRVSAWPLAPGWWIVLALLILLIFLAVLLQPWLKQRRKNQQWQKSTAQLLDTLYAECQAQPGTPISWQHYLQKSNDIFKRVMHSDPEWMAFSSRTGKPWIALLATINPHERYPALYGDTLYAAQCPEKIDIQDLHRWNVRTLQHIAKPDRALRKRLKEAAA